ncbi:PSP1 domain-containing protein [Miniphocaeibacter halophilus]|uniref:Stage 0 sporulation family protein n=1 Tax=Miniphocaeibacter halophilus TaxID=2931922 RepID=A0AC61MP93_9FIRM|nr:stage 0 sporulation family protein [Miniphocaeibacter halophilus]QQK07330.1 stage 0 sporulation family protein [Miniphocaeibacter halophilus]
MVEVVGIRFKRAGKIYYFSPNGFDIEKGNDVIVETARGIEFGKAIENIKTIEEKDLVSELKPVIRIADEADKYINKENKKKAKDALDICEIKAKEHNLDMKFVDCEYTFDNNKVIFYFTSDDRIDFRELVRDLASIFKTRIELRQIGVRDHAKLIGGLGSCGQPCCCSRFLSEFTPVSIKMAKDQSISLNPTKISGLCGRLMCCLKYEQEGYEEGLKKLPKVGTKINTPEGEGKVYDVDILTELIKVKILTEDDIEEIKYFYAEDIIGNNCNDCSCKCDTEY